jgi:hypothetical protein
MYSECIIITMNLHRGLQTPQLIQQFRSNWSTCVWGTSGVHTCVCMHTHAYTQTNTQAHKPWWLCMNLSFRFKLSSMATCHLPQNPNTTKYLSKNLVSRIQSKHANKNTKNFLLLVLLLTLPDSILPISCIRL